LTALLSYNHWFIICILVSLYSCSKDGDSEISDNTIQLNIDVQSEIPTDHKVNMTLTITEGGQPKTYTGRIERRGGFSISFPKQSFEIDLEEDISLAGLPSDDDWILNANYIDKTFLRHVISYDLFQQMSPNNIASQTQYVEVSINQIYNGLYVLMVMMAFSHKTMKIFINKRIQKLKKKIKVRRSRILENSYYTALLMSFRQVSLNGLI